MVAALSARCALGILIKNVADIEAAAKNQRLRLRQNRHANHRPACRQPARAHWRNQTGGIVAGSRRSAEKYSNHPTAKALAQIAGEAGVPLAEPQNFTETAGRGVKAEVGGSKVLVGRAHSGSRTTA